MTTAAPAPRKALLRLAFGCVTASLISACNSPTGIYVASGAAQSSNSPLNDVNVEGALVRVPWSQIETSPGVYDWNDLDRQVDTIECNAICYSGKIGGSCGNDLSAQGRGGSCVTKKWSLSVAGGPSSPTWLDQGSGNLRVGTFQITVNGNTATIPKFWDATLLSRLDKLATALSHRYGNDSNLRLVYIPQMSENGVEGQFNGVPDQTLIDAGFTVNNWVSAVEQTTLDFATAFPKTSVAVELHYLLNSSCAGLRIMHDIKANANEYKGRIRPTIQQIGAATWWLDGATNYQADLILGAGGGDSQDQIGKTEPNDPGDDYGRACLNQTVQANGFEGFIQAGGRVYTQAINQSAQTSAFPDGYSAIFTQAEQLGVKYVEVWQPDVGTSWESQFASFDSYAGD